MTAQNPVSAAAQAQRSPRRAWAVVVVLALMSLLSFLDRQVLAILVTELQRDLAISDVEIGWLIGPVFFIVYNLTLFPAALVVDRWNRKWMICFGVVIWSVMTIASGFAQDYGHLLVLRGGVAFGEALLGPAAISMIGDLFRRHERPLPTAVYIAGSTIGASGSALIAAMVLDASAALVGHLPAVIDAPWRLTLLGVGLPGLLLAALLALIGREPRHGDGDAASTDEPPVSTREHLRRHGLFYAGTLLGLGCLLMNMSSVALWAPTFLVRGFGLSQVQSGYYIGLVSLGAGLTGTLLLPVLIRALVRQGRIDAMVYLVIATIVGAALAAAMGGWATTLATALTGFGLFMFLAGAAATMPTLIVQLYVPASLRGRASAAVFFLLYLLGYGVAPLAVPMIAESFVSGPYALGRSIAVVAMISGTISAILLMASKRGFHKAEDSHSNPQKIQD